MPQIAIESIDDLRIAPYRDLPRGKLSRDTGLFVVEGRTLVERLLASDFEVHSVLLDQRYVESTGPSVPSDVPIYVTPDGLVDQIVGFKFHRGVIACGRRRAPVELEEVIPRDAERLTVAVGVAIGDPENLGSVLRNCAAFGVDAVVLGGGCADPFARRVLRVSMGTAFRLPLYESKDLADDLGRLRNQWKIEIAATVIDESAEPLAEVSPVERIALLFGSEGHGLDAQWIELCDRRITIPMSRGTDSLNVATASGIFLHHFTRDITPESCDARGRGCR